MTNERTTSVELDHDPQAAPIGSTGKVAMVHKQGAEGILLVDALTGHVLPGQSDRPEWSEGLVLAQFTERHIFYTNRLGPQYTDEHKTPELYAFEDLGWLGVYLDGDQMGEPMVLEADAEHRMNVLAQVLGVNRDGESITVEGATAEAEIARDDTRTGAEMAAFDGAQKEGFKEATGTN